MFAGVAVCWFRSYNIVIAGVTVFVGSGLITLFAGVTVCWFRSYNIVFAGVTVCWVRFYNIVFASVTMFVGSGLTVFASVSASAGLGLITLCLPVFTG